MYQETHIPWEHRDDPFDGMFMKMLNPMLFKIESNCVATDVSYAVDSFHVLIFYLCFCMSMFDVDLNLCLFVCLFIEEYLGVCYF